MVTFVDNDTPFPLYGKILEQFIEKFCGSTATLYLCYYTDRQSDVDTIDALTGVFAKLKNRVNLLPVAIEHKDDEAVIKYADYLILGRDIKNIQRINYAFKHGTKCLSGANNPIFRFNEDYLFN